MHAIEGWMLIYLNMSLIQVEINILSYKLFKVIFKSFS